MPAAPTAPPVSTPSKVEIPVTQPGPAPSPGESSNFDAEFSELDSLDDKPQPKAPAKPEPPKQPEKPKVEPPKVEAPKAPEKPQETEPKTIPELRKGYEAKKREIRDTWEPKVKALESEIATLKATAGNGHTDELKSLTEKVQTYEKRVAELEGTIKFVDYRKSDEFKKKYEAPYNEAWASAIGELDELTVKVRTGTDELGEPTYGERKASPNDLLTLSNLPLGEARKLAKEMFGDNADDMMAHRRKIRELSDAQNKALTEAQKAAEEAAKTRDTQSQEMSKQTVQLWTQANKTLAEKYPKWFGPVEGDEEGNTLLQKGFALADRMFAPTKETAPKTTQESVALHALIRNKVANHDRLAFQVKKLTKELEEARTELKGYQESEPGGRAGTPGGSGVLSAADQRAADDAEIEALNTD